MSFECRSLATNRDNIYYREVPIHVYDWDDPDENQTDDLIVSDSF